VLDPQPQYELTNPSTFNDTIKGGPLAGIFLEVQGVTAAGESLAPEDVASTVQVIRDGQGQIQQSFAHFHRFFQLHFGTLPNSGGTGEENRIVAFVPSFIPEAPTVKDLADREGRLNVAFDKATLDTRFGSNDYTVRVIPAYAEMLSEVYDLHIDQDTITQSDQETYSEPNHAHLVFNEATDGSNEAVDIEVDGKTKVGHNANLQDVNTVASLVNSVESDVAPQLIDYSLIQSGRLRDGLNGQVTIDLRGTSGEDVTLTRYRIEEARSAQLSLSRAQREFRRRLSATSSVDEQTRRTLQ
jgi:hypothetical protein